MRNHVDCCTFISKNGNKQWHEMTSRQWDEQDRETRRKSAIRNDNDDFYGSESGAMPSLSIRKF